jgi:hypothetical protein
LPATAEAIPPNTAKRDNLPEGTLRVVVLLVISNVVVESQCNNPEGDIYCDSFKDKFLPKTKFKPTHIIRFA